MDGESCILPAGQGRVGEGRCPARQRRTEEQKGAGGRPDPLPPRSAQARNSPSSADGERVRRCAAPGECRSEDSIANSASPDHARPPCSARRLPTPTAWCTGVTAGERRLVLCRLRTLPPEDRPDPVATGRRQRGLPGCSSTAALPCAPAGTPGPRSATGWTSYEDKLPHSVYVPQETAWSVEALNRRDAGGLHRARPRRRAGAALHRTRRASTSRPRGTGTNVRHVANILPEWDPADALLVVRGQDAGRQLVQLSPRTSTTRTTCRKRAGWRRSTTTA